MLRGERIKAFAKAEVQLKRQYAAFLEDFQKNYLVHGLVLLNCYLPQDHQKKNESKFQKETSPR